MNFIHNKRKLAYDWKLAKILLPFDKIIDKKLIRPIRYGDTESIPKCFYQSPAVRSHNLNMLTVKKFLFCFKLETGGLFMGWSGIISSLLFFLGFIVSLTFSFHDIVDYINKRFGVLDKAHLPMMSTWSSD